GGFTEGRKSRKHFGALVLGCYDDDGQLNYIGHTGGGFGERQLSTLTNMLTPLRREHSPFKVSPKTNMPVTWVEPEVVVDVIFRGWTESGILRQPVFSAVRDELDAKSIRRMGMDGRHPTGDGLEELREEPPKLSSGTEEE